MLAAIKFAIVVRFNRSSKRLESPLADELIDSDTLGEALGFAA